jgi:signal transduction histidine kinase
MILEGLGGKISAASKVGEGTTMRVALPLSEPTRLAGSIHP